MLSSGTVTPIVSCGLRTRNTGPHPSKTAFKSSLIWGASGASAASVRKWWASILLPSPRAEPNASRQLPVVLSAGGAGVQAASVIPGRQGRTVFRRQDLRENFWPSLARRRHGAPHLDDTILRQRGPVEQSDLLLRDRVHE